MLLIKVTDKSHNEPHKIYSDEELTEGIDPVLAQTDFNMNGFIEFDEYIIAYNKNEAAEAAAAPPATPGLQ